MYLFIKSKSILLYLFKKNNQLNKRAIPIRIQAKRFINK